MYGKEENMKNKQYCIRQCRGNVIAAQRGERERKIKKRDHDENLYLIAGIK